MLTLRVNADSHDHWITIPVDERGYIGNYTRKTIVKTCESTLRRNLPSSTKRLSYGTDHYCGPVAALAAAFSDPGISPSNYVSNTTGQVKPDDRDALPGRAAAAARGSPYFEGPPVASQLLYTRA
ncbi:hypothetical protein F5B18DRAFT_636009 [Nemania serpens]|nr:hypothetical protein F5B18DRAFT_636009 [Nemania serpens]